MSTIVTRSGKGSPLTHNEVDANFNNLNSDKVQSGDTVASLTLTTADINGGTIDGTVIGGTTPAAGVFTDVGTDAIDLAAIAETKGVTAVDVFVYDTSRDSDGGAWRKRTQHTSWYNETLNTSTRGSRREFPAVAVIVAESNKVTIYDGDDPSLPMWMVFYAADGIASTSRFLPGTNVTSVAAINGVLSVGLGDDNVSRAGLHLANFLSDETKAHRTTTQYSRHNGENIAGRNDAVGYRPDASVGIIVNNAANDVAMTVLPDAPIDPATGLPVPTIAVATDSGVSVIKDDGTVVDSASATIVDFLDFSDDYSLWLRFSGTAAAVVPSDTWLFDGFSYPKLIDNAAWSSSRIPTLNSPTKVIASTFADGVTGFGKLHEKQDDFGASMVTRTTSTYNTGWMNGNIKGAFLSDTDDTDLVGSGELVTNGTFDTDISGWTDSSLGTGTIAYDSGTMLLTSNGTSNIGITDQSMTTVVGKRYKFQVEITATTGALNSFKLGTSQNGSQYVSAPNLGVGLHTFDFVATSTTLWFRFNGYFGTGTTNIDNISVKLADADRSVNNNGLIVNGTVTRTPVATGADLVAYSGFSASNYLEQPYNSDLDFGTGDFCVMGWVKTQAAGGDKLIFSRSTTRGSDGFGMFITAVGSIRYQIGNEGQNNSTVDYGNGWNMFCLRRTAGTAELYVNGVFDNSDASTFDVDVTLPLYVGAGGWFSNTLASLALLRISATAPTAEQIKKIYEDEKVLFQENAQATLYGSSDAVTALAHDPVTDLLHVGTSAGRSVFQGLRRVDNTTDAVGTAISASGGMVLEE